MEGRLINPGDDGGDAFAEGELKVVLKRDHTVAVLPLAKLWDNHGKFGKLGI